MGFVFLLNRENGEPIFPIEERPVPQGAVKGDYLSPTQPFPTKPDPLTPINFDPENAYGFTFLDRGYCRAASKLRNKGLYTLHRCRDMHYPSSIGGANWVASVDSIRNILVVNTMNLASTIKMIPRADLVSQSKILNDRVQGAMFKRKIAGPLLHIAHGLMSRLEYLVPVRLGRSYGDRLAQAIFGIPLGTSKDLAPFPFTRIKGLRTWVARWSPRRYNFIAATSDYCKAFNTVTGEEIAKYRLPTGGHAVPMTYTSSRGDSLSSLRAGMGDKTEIICRFALPETE